MYVLVITEKLPRGYLMKLGGTHFEGIFLDLPRYLPGSERAVVLEFLPNEKAGAPQSRFGETIESLSAGNRRFRISLEIFPELFPFFSVLGSFYCETNI